MRTERPDGPLQRRRRRGAGARRLGRDPLAVRRLPRGEPESVRAIRPPEPLGAHTLLVATRGLYARAGQEVCDALHGRSGGTFRSLGVRGSLRHGQGDSLRLHPVSRGKGERGDACGRTCRRSGARRRRPGASRVSSRHRVAQLPRDNQGLPWTRLALSEELCADDRRICLLSLRRDVHHVRRWRRISPRAAMVLQRRTSRGGGARPRRLGRPLFARMDLGRPQGRRDLQDCRLSW